VSRLDRHLCAAAGHVGQRPCRCGRAGLHTPQETSYSRRSVAATRLCCALCLRVWCFSAPPSPVVLASDVQSCGPTVASSCRRARTTTSILGRGVGRLVALCIILRAAVRLPALVAHLLRVRARSSPLVQHAAQPPRCARARHRHLNHCSVRSRLDAASRRLHLLVYARLSQAVRLPPGRYQRRATR
jgi:hypothetical protein